MAAHHATARTASLPMGVPVRSPRRVWMIGVKGWLRANQATPAGMAAVGTKALDMNGATTTSSERLLAPAGGLASRPKEPVSTEARAMAMVRNRAMMPSVMSVLTFTAVISAVEQAVIKSIPGVR